MISLVAHFWNGTEIKSPHFKSWNPAPVVQGATVSPADSWRSEVGLFKYPLVNLQKTMERSTIFNGKIHYFYGYFQ
jgi:hypothetical protein